MSPSFRGERTCGSFACRFRGGVTNKSSSSDGSSDDTERLRLNEFRREPVAFSLPLLRVGGGGGDGVVGNRDLRRMEGAHISGDEECGAAEGDT